MSVELERIYKHIDEHLDEHVATLQEFVRQKSISHTGEGIRECARLVERYFKDLGCQETRIEEPGITKWGLEGDPAAAGSQAVMEDLGIDISDHRARRVDYDLLDSVDLILTMENGHKEALCMEFPAFSERIYLLSEMAGDKSDIEDPYGGAYTGYEAAAQDIQQYLDDGFDTIIQIASRTN